MDEQLKKALEALIDETINEIEDLKKSRFSASEVKIEGPGDGIAGKPTNGHLGKDEDEDEDEDKDDDAKKADDAEKADKDEDDDKDDDKDMEKAANREADPDGGHHKAPVEGAERGAGPSEAPKDASTKSGGKNREADPNGGKHRGASEQAMKADKDEPHKDDPKHEEKEKKMAKKLLDMHKGDKGMDKMGYGKGEIAKSAPAVEDLMKAMFDEKIAPLEAKLSSILDLVNKIGDQPVPPKGFTSRMAPLTKSADSAEPLNKGEVSSKLFDLKKSGTTVDSLDVTKAELGQDLQAIVKKYNLA